MKNWFMSKSVAVRSAIIVLIVALLTEAGVGAYALSKKQPKVQETASISEEVVVPEVEEVPVEEVVKEEEVKEEAKPAPAPAEEEVVWVAYTKNSTDLENGDFSDGLNAWEVYSFIENNIGYTADEVFEIEMDETGTEDWHVQLKQTGIRLEKGKWYSLSMDAKSSINRTIGAAMQRDGMIHNDDWTPYSQAARFNLGTSWKNYVMVFQMPENTDDASVFSLSMGTVDGKRISKTHTVSIDNIVLTKLPDNWTDSLKSGDNLVGNPIFEYEDTLWEASVVAPGAAKVSFANNKATFDITNPGTVDWHVQLKQNAINLGTGGYRLKFKASSTAARTIKVGFMDTNYVNWYGGGDVILNGSGEQEITVDFYNSIAADANTVMMISMGKIEGVTTPASTVTLSDFNLFKCDAVGPSAGGGGGSWADPTTHLGNGWMVYDHENNHTNGSSIDAGVITINVKDTGTEDWHVQLQNKNISLRKGKWYRISYEAKSTLPRSFGCMLQRDGANDNDWSPYSNAPGVETLNKEWTKYTQTFQMNYPSDNHAIYNFSFGSVGGKRITTPHTINIKNIKIKEVSAPVIPEPGIGDEMLTNAPLDGQTGWNAYAAGDSPAKADIAFKNGAVTFKITNVGDNPWDIALQQTGLKMLQGAKYRFTMDATSTVDRTVSVAIQTDAAANYAGIGEDRFTLTNGVAPAALANRDGSVYTFEFTAQRSYDNAQISINLGNFSDGTPTSTVVIKSVSLVKIEDPAPVGPEPEEPEEKFGEINVVVSGDERKGEYVIDPAIFGIENPVGKKIKAVAKLKSTGKFMGTIAGNAPSGWAQGDTYTSETGALQTWEYVLDTYVDYMKIDIWYMAADTVDIMSLEVTEVTGEEPENPTPEEGEMLTNGDFANGKDSWETYVHTPGGAVAGESFENGKAVFTITNPGETDWNVQLKQQGLTYEKGAKYEIKIDIASTEARTVKIALMGPSDAWYGGSDIVLGQNDSETMHSFEFTMNGDTTTGGLLQVSMGKVGESTPASTITINSISLKKVVEGAGPGPSDPSNPTPEEGEMLTNGDFANGKDSWETYVHTPGGAAAGESFENGKAVFTVTNPGETDWNVQLKQQGLTYEKGAKYEIKIDIASTEARTVKIALMGPSDAWYGGSDIVLGQNDSETMHSFVFTMGNDTTTGGLLQVSMGKVGESTPASTITINSISLKKVVEEAGPGPSNPTPAEGEMLTNGDFANGQTGWNVNKTADTIFTFTGGTAVIDVKSLGENVWDNQLAQDGLQLEAGAKYVLKIVASSTVERKATIGIQDKADYSGPNTEITLGTTDATFEIEGIFAGSVANAQVFLSVGNAGAGTPLSVITVKSMSLTKVEAAPTNAKPSNSKSDDSESSKDDVAEEVIIIEAIPEEEIIEDSTDDTEDESATVEDQEETEEESVPETEELVVYFEETDELA